MDGQLLRWVRALVASGGRGTLSGPSVSPRGFRMRRLVLGLLFVAALLSLGAGVYHRFLRTPPPPPEGPKFVDDQKAPLPEAEEFEHLAKTDPVAMYEKCLARYQREVTGGLAVTLVKKERVEGKPVPPEEPPEEVIALSVRGDVPDPATGKRCVEVLMKWQSGARRSMGSEMTGSFYSEKPGAEGTDNRVVTWRPKALLGKAVAVDPTDRMAREKSRFCIRDAGIYRSMLRTYTAWKQRKEAGTLKTEYLGRREVPELGGRVCHVIERTCPAPEADSFQIGDPPVTDPKVIEREGFTRVRVMIDAERWLQVGTQVYRPDGHLLASYYFRDPVTNPAFAPDTFTEAGLKK
ncbi:MAG: hypothetical protein C0501_20160 [Isosphaera sp.]|nr:hypothetical protein [Isosphaera sp.]